MARRSRSEPAGNYVSEWFGHRMHPAVVSTPTSIADQQAEKCPFLSQATNENRPCVKAANARGVCTVSSLSNGRRQDWLVCPYRALSDELVSRATRRLFAVPDDVAPFVTPAVTLRHPDTRAELVTRLGAGQPVFIYFDKKTGGELSIPPTERSPEFSFDVTIVELVTKEGAPHTGRFGILEIQTMDFHGSYKDAVRNLREGLRMHRTQFGETVQANQWWLSQGVEGPNIANVFKRTFYQMMFKFQLGQHERCAGCVLAVPQSVWDSWSRHLGAPELIAEPDGTFSLLAPGRSRSDSCPAWVYVFDPVADTEQTPSPIVLCQVIGTDAPSMSYWALEVAPAAALSNIDSETGMLSVLSRRLKEFWPELARTVVAEVAVDRPRHRPRVRAARPHVGEAPLEVVEQTSDYEGPGREATRGEAPDEN